MPCHFSRCLNIGIRTFLGKHISLMSTGTRATRKIKEPATGSIGNLRSLRLIFPHQRITSGAYLSRETYLISLSRGSALSQVAWIWAGWATCNAHFNVDNNGGARNFVWSTTIVLNMSKALSGITAQLGEITGRAGHTLPCHVTRVRTTRYYLCRVSSQHLGRQIQSNQHLGVPTRWLGEFIYRNVVSHSLCFRAHKTLGASPSSMIAARCMQEHFPSARTRWCKSFFRCPWPHLKIQGGTLVVY